MNTDIADNSIWDTTAKCKQEIQNVITLLRSGKLFVDSVAPTKSNDVQIALYDFYAIWDLAEIHCQKINNSVNDLIMSK